MSTSELKLHLHQLIESITDNSVLKAVQVLLSKTSSLEEEDWWNKLSEEHKNSIEKGLNQANKKEFFPHESVMSEVDKLLGRK